MMLFEVHKTYKDITILAKFDAYPAPQFVVRCACDRVSLLAEGSLHKYFDCKHEQLIDFSGDVINGKGLLELYSRGFRRSMDYYFVSCVCGGVTLASYRALLGGAACSCLDLYRLEGRLFWMKELENKTGQHRTWLRVKYAPTLHKPTLAEFKEFLNYADPYPSGLPAKQNLGTQEQRARRLSFSDPGEGPAAGNE
jgi:hypothetical protein